MKHYSNLVKVILLAIIFGFNLSVSAQTTYNYTGSVQTYTVPPGVTCINVDVQGAAGGQTGPMTPPVGTTTPGKGGRVQATLSVTPGTVLDVYVGGVGGDGNAFSGATGGYNGGGSSSVHLSAYSGGGGGGASDIRIPPYGFPDRVAVGAGGGGSGYDGACIPGDQAGGDGGGTTGLGVTTCDGTLTAFPYGYIVTHSAPGTPVAGGIGGLLSPGYSQGATGGFGIGGNNQATTPYFDGGIGGGGGAGWYGGGGGCWMGGAGGSSYTDPVLGTVVTHTPGFRSGNGIVIITPGLPPVAGTIVGPTTLCVGATATYTNPTAPPVVTWSSSNIAVATIGSSSGVANGLSGGVTTITCTVTSACGVTTSSITLTVAPLPVVAAISGPSTVCGGATITLSDPTAGGVWSALYGFASAAPLTGVITGVSSGVDTIKYTVSNACGTSYAAYPVTVNPLAPVGTIVGPTTVCVGLTITETDAVPGGTWSVTNGRATIAPGGVVTGVAVGLDTVVYSEFNACGINSTTQVINIISLPYPGVVTGPATVCVGSLITMADGVPGGIWGVSNNRSSVSLSGDASGIAIGLDTVMYAVTNVCGVSTATKTITVIDVPVVAAITGSSVVCPGTTITLADATSGGIWAHSNSLATVSSSGVVTGVTSGNTVISYTVTNSCGITTVIKNIDVLISPAGLTITGDTIVCPDKYDPFTASIPGGTWSITNIHAYIDETGVVGGVHEGQDTVIYTVTNACGTGTVTAPVFVLSDSTCSPLSVTTLTGSEASMKVYPNPNDGAFTLLLSSGIDEQVIVTVTSVIGEKVLTTISATNKATDIKLNMPAGIYLLNAATSHGRYVAKITVK